MKINDTKALLSNCVKASVKVPFLLVGTMGVGKSQIVKQVADENELQLVDLRLAQQEAGDLIGLPYKNGDGGTHWAKPEWFPKEGTKGIIFLDELNRAPTDVRQAVFQLVLDRRIHTHKLPDGWFVHAAINPDNGNYQVESLDPAMLRRFCNLVLSPTVEEWMVWARTSGKIDPSLVEFFNTQPLLLEHTEDIKLDVKRTRDSARMLSELRLAKVIPQGTELEVYSGLIGKEAAVALIKWDDTNYKKPVSGTEILKDYAKVAAKVKKQETAETYQTITDLATLVTPKKSLDAIELKNVTDFILDIPKESQAATIQKFPKAIREILIKDIRISKMLLSVIGE